ncbi:uncharacterized protein LAESUDRAFT_81998 [Laetiporus sulphureus 93-53]|uniref:Uncharacterized protein n=1 Tax=Laetiporus sulphureus 93-53 TaxID=1314785 RepID=A0A165F2G3_9APHY|nr:uncharacterized protein LAESUDRAFT_81998 [Laetiporus sulphureus 93-53]KZT08233.1 hypothetical protein LAESUDRAFT_81998 [Laetiporus sulphureus 93-53]
MVCARTGSLVRGNLAAKSGHSSSIHFVRVSLLHGEPTPASNSLQMALQKSTLCYNHCGRLCSLVWWLIVSVQMTSRFLLVPEMRAALNPAKAEPLRPSFYHRRTQPKTYHEECELTTLANKFGEIRGMFYGKVWDEEYPEQPQHRVHELLKEYAGVISDMQVWSAMSHIHILVRSTRRLMWLGRSPKMHR